MSHIRGVLTFIHTLLISIIFPKFCLGCGVWGSYLCPECTSKLRAIRVAICPYCSKSSSDGYTHPMCGAIETRLDGLKSLYYFSPPLSKIISSLKYRLTTQTSPDLAKLIHTQTSESIRSFGGKVAIFVPIPLHSQRQKDRGFNQSELLAEILSRQTEYRSETNLLKRIKNTPPQVKTKSREERLANLSQAFAINKRIVDSYKNKTIILVDDVWTSGATMKEAARVLKKAGIARVLALTFAH